MDRDRTDEDLLAELGAWIRNHPDSWEMPSDVRMSDQRVSELVAQVLHATTDHQAEDDLGRRRRLRRIAIAAALGVVVGGAGVAAAAILWPSQPKSPEAGVVCRAEPRADSEAIVLEPGIDPIAGCTEAWSAGRFETAHRSVAPPLVTCIGRGGAIEVFPGMGDLCHELGLAPAAGQLDQASAAVVRLQEAVASTINEPTCVTGSRARFLAGQLLQRSELHQWSVSVEAGTDLRACSKAAVDSSSRRVVISER